MKERVRGTEREDGKLGYKEEKRRRRGDLGYGETGGRRGLGPRRGREERAGIKAYRTLACGICALRRMSDSCRWHFAKNER